MIDKTEHLAYNYLSFADTFSIVDDLNVVNYLSQHKLRVDMAATFSSTLAKGRLQFRGTIGRADLTLP